MGDGELFRMLRELRRMHFAYPNHARYGTGSDGNLEAHPRDDFSHAAAVRVLIALLHGIVERSRQRDLVAGEGLEPPTPGL